MKAVIASLLVLMGWAGTAHAQHQHGSGYAAMATRPIKALSEDQITQLREGRGMGLSLPAELNSYPGPMHALELANALRLTPDQRTRLNAIKQQMSSRAIALGHQVIAAEAQLDRAFASGQADPSAVVQQLSDIGHLNGELRSVHILAHMETRALLTPDQVARYDAERGYRPAGHQAPQRHNSGEHRRQH
ncbi:Spy/CpxP family protein refolding chaperone [Ferrovibrio terrae]|nr:periplasmic heavy metal sensor [Ferrovibrio terrae]